MRTFKKALPLTLTLWMSAFAWAHQGVDHSQGPARSNQADNAQRVSVLKAIQEDYKRRVEPIFQKSCMDCHSSKTRYPWYYKIPGIRQLVDSDIQEARQHLDFTDGYPFRSHATPVEDLDAIAESIQNGSMPPLRYWLIHWDAPVTQEERAVIQDWAIQSKSLLLGETKK